MAREFLDQLSPGDREYLFDRGRPRRWPAGATLFGEGDRSATVVLVLSGRAKVFSLTEQGGEVLLAIRGPGALLGEMSALDGAPNSVGPTVDEAVALWRELTGHGYREQEPLLRAAFIDYLQKQ